ncbi:MAG: hypothetical protein ACK5O2_01270, partial [Microthrixaceae bacterium]
VRIGGSSGLLVAMVGDALPAGSGESVAASGADGGAFASVFTVTEAADRARVDRATVAKLREVAKAGALDALAQSRPGRREKQRDVEMDEAQAEIERLRTALAEMAVRLTLAEGKEPWG